MIYSEDGILIARTCTKCGTEKRRDEFNLRKRSPGGIRPECRECQKSVGTAYRNREGHRGRQSERGRAWYLRNKEKHNEVTRKWYEENKERHAELMREHREKNPELYLSLSQRRRARKLSLPDDLTDDQLTYLMYYFGDTCALTGEEGVDIDHVIPLATGHGGTTIQNLIPLRSDLNKSKNARNIFVWFEENKDRLCLPQHKFDIVIEYLAELNCMTPEEYRDYVYFCHENPNEIKTKENA